MSISTKSALKALFETGDTLLQSSFIDLIDTLCEMKRTLVSASPYSQTDDDVLIAVNVAGAVTINLLAVAGVAVGKRLIIKDESGAAAANNITVDAAGAELIDGAATSVINTNYGVLRIYCNGAKWLTW